MKLFEIVDDFENQYGFPDKKTELIFLHRKTNAIRHQLLVWFKKILALVPKDIVYDSRPLTLTPTGKRIRMNDLGIIEIPGTGGKLSGYKTYYGRKNDPQVQKLVAQFHILAKQQENVKQRIKDIAKEKRREMKVNDITEASETPHKHIIWVDDLRSPPTNIEQSCDVARTYDEAIGMLSKHMYTDMYLDHDIGDFSGPEGRERTGYDVLMFLVQRKHDNQYVPKNFHILTNNPVGRQKFEGVINRYLRS